MNPRPATAWRARQGDRDHPVRLLVLSDAAPGAASLWPRFVFDGVAV